jgi:uncharacterized protein
MERSVLALECRLGYRIPRRDADVKQANAVALERSKDMANPFVHIELTTDNLGKAKEFYGKLFSWSLEDMRMPDGMYTMLKTGDGPGGGMMNKPSPEVPTAWLPYVQVDSVDATVTNAKKLGGKIMKDKTPIPEMGAFAILLDPTGAALGVWEYTKK